MAHVSLICRTLPADFNHWGILDARGRSVGHLAAFLAIIPPNYTDWDLIDSTGITVREAHGASVAARYKDKYK